MAISQSGTLRFRRPAGDLESCLTIAPPDPRVHCQSRCSSKRCGGGSPVSVGGSKWLIFHCRRIPEAISAAVLGSRSRSPRPATSLQNHHPWSKIYRSWMTWCSIIGGFRITSSAHSIDLK